MMRKVENKNKVKALVLLSGGLDSMLAARVLIEQGIKVTGISFVSNFFGSSKARRAAKKLGIELIEYDFKKEHLKIVKNPKHGYGKNMNPCIDCHGLMIKKAGELMKKKAYSFVATGEVLGQRPMSQNKQSLKLVEQYAGIEGYLIRPLSAKLLDKTLAEDEALVDREKLLDIEGRTRSRQIELAKKFSLKDYPSPGGGCLLTDPVYSKKLAKLQSNWPEFSGDDAELIQRGRVKWLKLGDENVLAVIGRHKEDNEHLSTASSKGDILVELDNAVGPTTVLRNKNRNFKFYNLKIELEIPKELDLNNTEESFKDLNSLVEYICLLTGYYSVKVRGQKINFKVINK